MTKQDVREEIKLELTGIHSAASDTDHGPGEDDISVHDADRETVENAEGQMQHKGEAAG